MEPERMAWSTILIFISSLTMLGIIAGTVCTLLENRYEYHGTWFKPKNKQDQYKLRRVYYIQDKEQQDDTT